MLPHGFIFPLMEPSKVNTSRQEIINGGREQDINLGMTGS
jgi:hypothetical protein